MVNEPSVFELLRFDCKQIIRLNVGKRTFGYVRPAKVRISLRLRAIRSESLLGSVWISKDAKYLPGDSEDSDQPSRDLISLRLPHDKTV